ncbi:MAG: EAL domain-containing protein [Marivibrio sp.]|uniref:putative bifunctional diguanylate cyclase/phosphodiesterase n=1 Tax=Marivibrio sp. TaxID=2039719 RepID=UPI0032EB971F
MSVFDPKQFDFLFYKTALEKVGEGVVVVDRQSRILWSNSLAAEIFRAPGPSLAGYALDDILPQAHRAQHADYIDRFFEGSRSRIIGQGRNVTGRAFDERPLELYVNVTHMTLDGRDIFLTVVRDVSMEREFQRSMHHRSVYDFITQLLNREGFMAAGRQRHIEAALDGAPLWLGVLNVSGVGKINQWIGYEAGDLALHEIGVRMADHFPEPAILGRVDGNEFAVLLPVDRAPRSPEAFAAAARAIGRDIDVGGRHIDIRFTGGAAFSADGPIGEPFVDFFARARTALREARIAPPASGVRFYDSDLDRREHIARALEDGLVHALARDEFFIQVQPKVDMDRRTAGYEALLRWRTADGELVSPADFIPLAEANGTIRLIGLWVFQQVCRLAAAEDFAGRDLRISVNLSPRQMEQEALPEMLAKICADSGCDPAVIELEVTESWAVQDYERGSGVLEALKAKGFGVSLDDFGTGYSSLSALVRLPVDVIKIDRSLLPSDAAHDPEAAKLLGATIDLCRALGREVLVEGVESEDQFRLLAELDCDLAQGYLFGRPQDYARCAAAVDPAPDLAYAGG